MIFSQPRSQLGPKVTGGAIDGAGRLLNRKGMIAKGKGLSA